MVRQRKSKIHHRKGLGYKANDALVDKYTHTLPLGVLTSTNGWFDQLSEVSTPRWSHVPYPSYISSANAVWRPPVRRQVGVRQTDVQTDVHQLGTRRYCA